jgi:hypothetical protein
MSLAFTSFQSFSPQGGCALCHQNKNLIRNENILYFAVLCLKSHSVLCHTIALQFTLAFHVNKKHWSVLCNTLCMMHCHLVTELCVMFCDIPLLLWYLEMIHLEMLGDMVFCCRWCMTIQQILHNIVQTSQGIIWHHGYHHRSNSCYWGLYMYIMWSWCEAGEVWHDCWLLLKF